MIDYTIMEYNIETKKYTTLGYAMGNSSSEAKKKFAEETRWEPKKDIILFAKIPTCR